MIKKITPFIIILIIAISLIFVGAIIFAACFPYNDNWETAFASERVNTFSLDKYLDENQDGNISAINKINIKTDYNLKIVNHDSQTIRVVAERKVIALSNNDSAKVSKFERVNDTVEIEFTQNTTLNFFSIVSIDSLTVYIPASYNGTIVTNVTSGKHDINTTNLFKKVDLNSASGKITIKNITVEEMVISNKSGSMDIDNATAKTIYVNSQSGKITLSDITTDSIKVDCKSGNTSITNITGKTIDVNSQSGKIILNDITADNIKVDCKSGNVTINDVVVDNMSLDVVSGSVTITLSKMCDIITNLSSGNLKITAPANKNITVNYDISSGRFVSKYDGNSTYKNRGTIKYGTGNDYTIDMDLKNGNANLYSQ